jgi:hypothetical protein
LRTETDCNIPSILSHYTLHFFVFVFVQPSFIVKWYTTDVHK